MTNEEFRDLCAIAAMQSYLRLSGWPTATVDPRAIALDSYLQAEAMTKQRRDDLPRDEDE